MPSKGEGVCQLVLDTLKRITHKVKHAGTILAATAVTLPFFGKGVQAFTSWCGWEWVGGWVGENDGDDEDEHADDK